MNYKEIEELKSALTNMMKKGSTLRVPAYGASGKVVGIGFKPYWTNPGDSKIEKLEINFMDASGRVIPFNFFNIIGYEVISRDGKDINETDNVSLDIHVYSPLKSRGAEPYDKIRIEIGEV